MRPRNPIKRFLARLAGCQLVDEPEVIFEPEPVMPIPEEIVEDIIEPPLDDPTGWMLENAFADFVLMNSDGIRFMCLLGYAYLHGNKVFKTIGNKAPFSYKIVHHVMACTGGGIMVPIFINSIPVPLASDAIPIAILVAFALHTQFPILREVMELSAVFKGAMVFLFEIFRTMVVTKFTDAAGTAIAASEFSFPVFGPIICGTIAGCGGAFLPFNKGLDPIKENGLAPNMLSAFVGATVYHLFVNLSADSVVAAPEKARVAVGLWFIIYGMFTHGVFGGVKEEEKDNSAKKSRAEKRNGNKKEH